MVSVKNIATGVTGGAREIAQSVYARREELMRGSVDKLWALRYHDDRVFLCNISRDIEVQEAWFTDSEGQEQALGPIRPGEHSEIRALRDSEPAETLTGTVAWRVRSMLLPWVSISRNGRASDIPQV